ncbi:MAG: propionyl-CoA synthetase [Acidimicrobiia bacterium]
MGADSYETAYRRTVEDPIGFWREAAEMIDWYKPPRTILDESHAPFYRWFPDGLMNTCHNALDRHVETGRADQDALIWDSPVTGQVERYTYADLRDRVAVFAGALRRLGVAKGDRVVIYMPMIPEALIAMLSCARLGAVHSVVFGGFAAPELAARIDDARPNVVVAASCGIEPARVVEYKPLLSKAIALANHPPATCVIVQRPGLEAPLTAGRDITWTDAVADAEPAECVAVAGDHPLYILYTSGTTGAPKGVVRDNGGHAVALCWSIGAVYGIQPGEVYWAASDIGWAVGHSYTVYGPLLRGCTTVLYEGKPVGTPDPGAFWRVVSDHKVNVLFTAPTAFRAIKREDPGGIHLRRYDVSSLRQLFLAGERLDPATLTWAGDLLGIPVIDHWWQTETGWPAAANCVGLGLLPTKPGSPTKPVPGYRIEVVDDEGNALSPNEEGNIVIRLPLPPGTLVTLWNADDRYVASYLERFPGFYLTGDGGFIDEDGYLFVMGRTDDVINVAGHRLSTGAMEEVLAAHPDVAEAAVIGVGDEIKGQIPLGLITLKAGVERLAPELESELQEMVRDRIGPVAVFRKVVVVARLPKTRSGKILRGTLRRMAAGRPYDVPAAIDDPTILSELLPALIPGHKG